MGIFVAPPIEQQPVTPQPLHVVVAQPEQANNPQPSINTSTTTTNNKSEYNLNNSSRANASALLNTTQINNFADVSREQYGDIQISRPTLNIYANYNGQADNSQYTVGVNVSIPLGGYKARKAATNIAVARSQVADAKICTSVRDGGWNKEMVDSIFGAKSKYQACVNIPRNLGSLPSTDVELQDSRDLFEEIKAENAKLRAEIDAMRRDYYQQKQQRKQNEPVRGLW